MNTDTNRSKMSAPTPETDAAWSCFKGHTELLHDVKNLSRKLERERDEARKETEYYKTRYEQLKERPKNPKWYNNREIPAEINEETK